MGKSYKGAFGSCHETFMRKSDMHKRKANWMRAAIEDLREDKTQGPLDRRKITLPLNATTAGHTPTKKTNVDKMETGVCNPENDPVMVKRKKKVVIMERTERDLEYDYAMVSHDAWLRSADFLQAILNNCSREEPLENLSCLAENLLANTRLSYKEKLLDAKSRLSLKRASLCRHIKSKMITSQTFWDTPYSIKAVMGTKMWGKSAEHREVGCSFHETVEHR